MMLALPIWTAMLKAMPMCFMKPGGSAVKLEHLWSRAVERGPKLPKVVRANGKLHFRRGSASPVLFLLRAEEGSSRRCKLGVNVSVSQGVRDNDVHQG